MVARGYEPEEVADKLKTRPDNIRQWAAEYPHWTTRGQRVIREKLLRKNPAKRIHENQDPWRHKRGTYWGREQKLNVVDLIKRGFSVRDVYLLGGASKRKQSEFWKEITGRNTPPPNFPSMMSKKAARKRRPERAAGQIRRSRPRSGPPEIEMTGMPIQRSIRPPKPLPELPPPRDTITQLPMRPTPPRGRGPRGIREGRKTGRIGPRKPMRALPPAKK